MRRIERAWGGGGKRRQSEGVRRNIRWERHYVWGGLWRDEENWVSEGRERRKSGEKGWVGRGGTCRKGREGSGERRVDRERKK